MHSDQFNLSPLQGDDLRTQYGAVCWRVMNRKVEVLLVTSRETGRWVIPKGWPIPGLSPEDSAAREAFEEAGVEGRVDSDCIGVFSYDKALGKPSGPRQIVPCVVAVYALRVERLRMTFPERDQRRRKWFSPEKAARKVAEPELQHLLAHAVLHVGAAGAGPKA
ncbi:NUDIX hydrolase [Paracoccaceae bacterium Fryx2]|nr:NUDIX hydrolase [Paracoccaceae bacterium Fryx2]